MNSRILVVGGEGGIGKALVAKLGERALVWGREEMAQMGELPPLAGLVYLPGTIGTKPFDQVTDEEFVHAMEVNHLGAVRAIRHAHPYLEEGSSIVLISSVVVARGMPFHANIASAKGAVEALTRSLAAEFAPTIRVNAVAPSLTDTPLAAGILTSDQKRENLGKRHPLQRLGKPEDPAAAIAYLLSEEASWVTGQILHVDGGFSTLSV